MKFFGRKLKPVWTYRTDKKVWRLLPGNGILAAELRDTDKKLTDYAAIDIASGSPLWQGLRLEDSWWIIMNRIFRDVLLLQQFVKPDMPTPGKIFAVDLFTGKILWENHEVSYLSAGDDLVYALRASIRSEEVVGLDYRTGLEKLSFPAEDPRTDQLPPPQPQDGFTLPVFVEEIQDEITLSRISGLKGIPPENAKNPTFIPSVAGKDISGYHTGAGNDEKGVPFFDSHVMIIDERGDAVYGDVADSKVYTAMSDFYFAAGNTLIYVRNSNEIVAVNLEK